MKHKARKKGFSLVELMIVVAIVAILVALAIPSYTKYIRKANRGEAQQLLLNWANNQEIWRASHTTYTDGSADANGNTLPAPTHDKYNFFVRQTVTNPPALTDCANATPSATEYALVACPTGDQANDTERGQSCNPIALNQSNLKLRAECW